MTASGPIRLHGLELDVAGMSEQGPRSENQDAFLVDAFEGGGLVAVADGMGGERSGRVAADTALRALAGVAPIRSLDEARRAARGADQAVTSEAEVSPEERGGMGCALALLSLISTRADGPMWIAGHVGDVRILSRTPDGTVRLETRDHTPAFARWEAGEVELDEVADTPGANRLQRAVGRGGEADVAWIPARPGWSYVLISDGVTKAMRLDELGEALATGSAADACERIRRKVLERGPDDNFTAVVVRIHGGDATLPGPPAAALRAAHPVPPTPVSPTQSRSSSPWLLVIGVLSLLALAASGYALWSARQAADARAAGEAEIQQLRAEVDSLRAQLGAATETFGPTAEAAPPIAAPSGATGATRAPGAGATGPGAASTPTRPNTTQP